MNMKKLFIVTLCITLLSGCSLVGQENRNATTGNTAAGTTTANTGTSANTGTTANTAGTTETGTTGAAQPTTSGQTASAAAISDYFPLIPNVHAVYKGTGNEYASYEAYVDYIRGDKIQVRENNGGTESIHVYAVRNGKLINTYNRGETYYKYDYTSVSDGEDIIMMEPIEVGNMWTAKDGSVRIITSVNSQIQTPAGKYTAVEVTTKGKDSTVKNYFAKGAGLIKTTYGSSDGKITVTSELEKLEKDIPYSRIINCYYPQFKNDRIVYMERGIDIKTNEDMKYKFQKELKIVPTTGGLSKTLTKNTKILGIKVDETRGTVTVDLSSDFIREMNAGSGFESMLIQSIVNTFGDYYQKSKVIITIEGKPYESGHILMKPGEAFDVKTQGVARYK